MILPRLATPVWLAELATARDPNGSVRAFDACVKGDRLLVGHLSRAVSPYSDALLSVQGRLAEMDEHHPDFLQRADAAIAAIWDWAETSLPIDGRSYPAQGISYDGWDAVLARPQPDTFVYLLSSGINGQVPLERARSLNGIICDPAFDSESDEDW